MSTKVKGHTLIDAVLSSSERSIKRGYWSGGGSTLIAACSKGDLTLVRRCLLGQQQQERQQEGAPLQLLLNVNDSGPFSGPSPLSAAATAGALDVCRFLVEVCGAEVDAVDGTCLTAFQRACFAFRLDVMEYLATEGQADVRRPVSVLKRMPVDANAGAGGGGSNGRKALSPLALLDRFIGFDQIKPLLIRLGASPLDLRRPLSAAAPSAQPRSFTPSAAAATPSRGSTSRAASCATPSSAASADTDCYSTSASFEEDSLPIRLARPYPPSSPAGIVMAAIRDRAWQRRGWLVCARHAARKRRQKPA